VSDFESRLSEDSVWRTEVGTYGHAVDRFRKEAKAITDDIRLTKVGQAEKIRELAQKGPVQFLAEMRKHVERERADLARRATEFELRPPRKEDMFSELQRQEKRAFLRGLTNPGERLRLAASDPEFAEAAVHGHPSLSGLDDDGQGRARKFLLERQFGAELKAIAAESADIDVAESALSVAEMQIRSLADLKPKKESVENG
jgi:hypothetical protein